MIGLDLGYAYVKAVSRSRRVMFPSVIGTPDVARFDLLGSGNLKKILDRDGHKYAYGSYAVSNSRMVYRNEDRSWIESELYMDLFAASINELYSLEDTPDMFRSVAYNAYELPISGIVTGLPVVYYSDKEKLVDIMSKPTTVKLHNHPGVTIKILPKSVRVIPQPFGTVLNEALDDNGQIRNSDMVSSMVGVIDIGGKTTNILGVKQLSDKTSKTTSVNIGGWDIVRAVSERLASTYPDLTLIDSAVMVAMADGVLHYYGETKDISGIVEDCSAPIIDGIRAEVGKLWNRGAEFDSILITGGGSRFVGKRLCEIFPQARMIDEPNMSNVSGYYKLATRLFGG